MIADIDKKGNLSLMELDKTEQTAIFEALVRYDEALSATSELIEGNDFTARMRRSVVKLLRAISIVTVQQQ